MLSGEVACQATSLGRNIRVFFFVFGSGFSGPNWWVNWQNLLIDDELPASTCWHEMFFFKLGWANGSLVVGSYLWLEVFPSPNIITLRACIITSKRTSSQTVCCVENTVYIYIWNDRFELKGHLAQSKATCYTVFCQDELLDRLFVCMIQVQKGLGEHMYMTKAITCWVKYVIDCNSM